MNPNVYGGLGNSLCGLAIIKNDEQLYIECFYNYKKAVELNSDIDFIYNSWGNAIYELAKIRNDERLYLDSFEKFELAIKFYPDDILAYYFWGNALFYFAGIKRDKKLYYEAVEKFEKAAELDADEKEKIDLYNMACSYAIVDEKIKALNVLERMLKRGYVKVDYVLSDEDWKKYKDDDDFKNLVNKFR